MSRSRTSNSRKAQARRGIVVVVAGPSGSGKSTLVKRLLNEDRRLGWSVSYTTRPRRPGERNGRDYHFVSQAEFQRMIRRGEFLEYAHVFGLNYYGTGKNWIRQQIARGRDILLEVDLEGARSIRRRLPGAILVFIEPPSMAELKRRLRNRKTDTPQQIRKRLRTAEREMRAAREFDYAVRNDEIDRALNGLKYIVGAERLRVQR
ncbi:MAG: guanylate kinase [Deltaproteobacteria bacterium]|nr:guanylate kinase [Deltaproteobacteria bacterium]